MKIKKRIKRFWLILRIMIFLCILVIIVSFISGYYSDRVKMYAKQKATSNASVVISEIINDNILENLQKEDITKTSEGKVIINTFLINEILKESTSVLSKNINDISSSEVFIPISIIFSEVFFSKSDLGLSIKTRTVGSFMTDIVSSVEAYGINNSLLKVELVVKIDVQILIPFSTEKTTIETRIPIIMTILQGDVPPGIFYGN